MFVSSILNEKQIIDYLNNCSNDKYCLKRRLSRKESRGMEKKSLLLKPGFSAKKSVSSDNLSAHDPKQWSSTVKKPNVSRQLTRSITSINMTGINLIASTPCVTPGNVNPNLPGMNSSYK